MDIARHIENTERNADAIIATAFEYWPEELKALAVAKAIVSIPVAPNDLANILSHCRSYRRFRGWSTERNLNPIAMLRQKQENSDHSYFLKLGPCSWRERADLSIWSETTADLHPLSAVLTNITDRMAIILHAFLYCHQSTYLHFFPFVDFSNVSEYRFRIRNRKITFVHAKYSETSPIVTCVDNSDINSVAERILSNVDLNDCLIDLAAGPNWEGWKVVEINPVI